MRVWALVSVLLVGCSDEAPLSVGARRDALALPVAVLGRVDAGAGFGGVLSQCQTSYLVAGQGNVIYTSALPGFLPPTVGADVLTCRDGAGMLGSGAMAQPAGGALQLYSGTSWQYLVPTLSASAAARSPDGTVIAIGANAALQFYSPVNGQNLNLTTLTGDAGWVGSIAWAPDSKAFAVSTPQELTASVFAWTTTGATWLGTFHPPTNETFGLAMALGHFHPDAAGVQLAIASGAKGKVFIFDPATGTLLNTLTGTIGSFGTSLATRNHYIADLDGLLVGDPDVDQVTLLLGDAGVQTYAPMTPPANFGAAMTRFGGPNGSLAIGGPKFATATPAGFAQVGAVFTTNLNENIAMTGSPGACVAGAQCVSSTNCTWGQCLGGVVCENINVGCPSGWYCSPSFECLIQPVDGGAMFDAGIKTLDGGATLDAGMTTTDAGSSVDAGQVDAGQVDAGQVDAGTLPLDAGPTGGGADTGGGTGGGMATDAGAAEDAGFAVDAGASNETIQFGASGCNCDTGLSELMVLSLMLLRRRERTAHRVSEND